mmetsp:Transcript_28175/g.68401  ORF Transcript_28175/g.68401 Transcript_28175/m.68401 type:complete len:224 (-) Transcript_28175:2036-2707(-)
MSTSAVASTRSSAGGSLSPRGCSSAGRTRSTCRSWLPRVPASPRRLPTHTSCLPRCIITPGRTAARVARLAMPSATSCASRRQTLGGTGAPRSCPRASPVPLLWSAPPRSYRISPSHRSTTPTARSHSRWPQRWAAPPAPCPSPRPSRGAWCTSCASPAATPRPSATPPSAGRTPRRCPPPPAPRYTSRRRGGGGRGGTARRRCTSCARVLSTTRRRGAKARR